MNTAYFDHSSTTNGFYNAAAAEAHQAAYRSFSQSALSLMPGPGGHSYPGSNVHQQNSLPQSASSTPASGLLSNEILTSSYVDAACKLYDSKNSAAAAAAAAAVFKSDCSPSSTSTSNSNSNAHNSSNNSNNNNSSSSASSNKNESNEMTHHHQVHHSNHQTNNHHHQSHHHPHQTLGSAWGTSLRQSSVQNSGGLVGGGNAGIGCSSGGTVDHVMRTSFDAAAAACSRSAITDAWCNANAMSAGTMGGPPNNFYPWMAIAGEEDSYW